MGKYRGYEKYKDSGVKWLGKIPEHWDSISVSRLTSKITNGYVGPTRDILFESGIRYIQSLHIKDGKVLFDRGHYFVKKEWSDQHQKSKLKLGDILIVQTGDIGQTALVRKEYENCNCHALIIMTPIKEKIDGSFLELFLRSQIGQYFLKCYQTGALHPHLNGTQIKDIKITLPPLDEQEAIARFLDYKTKQIDDLIKKKETLIEKLDEKRTALISHAVTKGLDPTVPMKDSGIEWLGEIPESWKRGKLNYFCQIISGGTPDRNNPDFWEGDIPWVKTGEVNYQNIYSTEEYITKEGLNSSSTTLVKPETVLMAMYGQGNTRGRVAILKIEAAFNQACLGISPLSNLNVYFLYYYLISAYKYIRDTGNESSQMNLSAGLIGKISILIPNLEVQPQIVKFLDQKTAEIAQQKAKIQEAIERLKEYRTALITNAVTGKIDVRQVPIP